MNSTAWTGQLTLLPGAPAGAPGALHLQRPDVAAKLLEGCAAAAVPARVGAVFTLCAQVQAFTSRQALAAASDPSAGQDTDHGLAPASAREQLLATAREQLLRITQDWPAALAGAAGLAEPPRLPPPVLAACPLWRRGLADAERLAQLAPWLAEHLLGMAPDAWLAAHLAEPETWAMHWCQKAAVRPLPTASLLHAVAPLALALATPQQAWAWPAGAAPAAAAAQRLALAITGEPAFALQPTWQGQPGDTGPWQRVHGPALGAQAPCLAAAASRHAWGRLISRLADLVWLACTPQLAQAQGFAAPRLSHGAVATGTRQALAWCEMARGLLVHWVQLADAPGGPVVLRYRVIAPTEWNCHPQGGLAQAVAGLAPGSAAAARLLALAYDPCVPVHVLHQPHPEPEEPLHA